MGGFAAVWAVPRVGEIKVVGEGFSWESTGDQDRGGVVAQVIDELQDCCQALIIGSVRLNIIVIEELFSVRYRQGFVHNIIETLRDPGSAIAKNNTKNRGLQ